MFPFFAKQRPWTQFLCGTIIQNMAVAINLIPVTNLWRRTNLSVIGWTAAIMIAMVALPGEAASQGRPIKATLVQNLDFGIFGATNVTGQVTVRPDGTKLMSAGIIDLGGIVSPAVFLIQGEKNLNFSITLPLSASIAMSGGTSAVLTDFQSSPAITGTLNQQGQATVTVGATLNVDPTLWEGVYSNPFDIIVAYQ